MSRALSCPIPSNINPLNPNGFMFSISRLPEVTFFCQEVNLPSISMTAVDMPTPFANYPIAGDRVEFGDLSVQFLVDSQMANYKAVFNWIRGLGFPETNEQYIEQVTTSIPMSEVAASTSNATLVILGSGSSPVQTISFADLIPVSLESLVFNTTSQDVLYLVGNATFRYAYYNFEDMSN